MANAIQSLWRDQEPELNRISIEEIRDRADLALSQDRKHKLVALLTASVVIACFVVFSVLNSTIMGRVGGVVGISAGAMVVYRACRLVSSYPLLPSAFGIEAYRRILDREQRGLAICWQTMLLVQLGVALEVIGDSVPGSRRFLIALAMVAPVVVVAFLTRAKARAYGRRSRELRQL